ncbi:MAG: class I SAM-dependent methyltransferase [Armatimonadota bacterium]|nr:class I SAM-dependent methyltransferase [Armatimonadota bacterium]
MERRNSQRMCLFNRQGALSPKVEALLLQGKTTSALRKIKLYATKIMSKIKKIIKTGIAASLCGAGLFVLARRYGITSKIAEFAQNIEAVPFPGTELYSFLLARQLRPLYAEIASEIHEEGRFARILDLDTGPGYLPIELALRNHFHTIVGMDRSIDMVRVAKANARASNVEKVIEFTQGEPTNIPFPGRYFDLVVSVNVLHHWRNSSQVFDEIYRILNPGGEFWLYDYQSEVPLEEWQKYEKELPIHLRLAFEVGPMASWRAAYSKKELLEIAEATHFADAEVEPRTFTLFGKPMSVFFRLRLRKPDQTRIE